MEINRENLLKLINSERELKKLSISALEKQSGVPKDTVRDFLRGKTQVLRADKLQKILRILQPENKVLVTGYVGQGAEIFSLAGENIDCPPGFSSADVSAVRVIGDSMLPVFYDGWIIYYSNKTGETAITPTEGWQVPYNKPACNESLAEFIGKPCIIKLTDGRLFLRTLKRGSATDRYNLIAYNATEIRDAEITWTARIVFIRT